jgi:hypothetical protein
MNRFAFAAVPFLPRSSRFREGSHGFGLPFFWNIYTASAAGL